MTDPATRRLQKEAMELKTLGIAGIKNLKIADTNIRNWEAMVVPTAIPYNKGAFKFEVIFPEQYPFKPPTIKFKTKIYHPNIDEAGQVCLNIINSEQWKPATKIIQVFEALVKLVNEPEPDHPLRADLAEEFVKNRSKFNKNAEAFTKKNAEKRP